ncbi:MAG: hypothetical protein GEU74_16155, partial [Nitriliruptorales bacterium]|nr:hypothetical protein [Nitriliruptorales bacterium]
MLRPLAWRHVVTLLCLVGVLSPAAIGAAAGPEDKLDAVEKRLDGAKKNLRGVERRKAVELADLQRIDTRRAELDRELAGLNEQLSDAETQLADSRAALQSTTQKLVATEGRLADTRQELTKTRKQFNARARSTYMYGGQAGWTGLVLGVETISTFERGLKYARVILADDQRQVERMTVLETTIRRTTADLEVLQKRRAAQQAVDADRRDAAAAI